MKKNGEAYTTTPPRAWWVWRVGVAIVLSLFVVLSGTWEHSLVRAVTDFCGVAGSICFLLGAWRSIRIRENLVRISLIVSDEEPIKQAAIDLLLEQNKQMMALLSEEWRWYITGCILIAVAFGVNGLGKFWSLLLNST